MDGACITKHEVTGHISLIDLLAPEVGPQPSAKVTGSRLLQKANVKAAIAGVGARILRPERSRDWRSGDLLCAATTLKR